MTALYFEDFAVGQKYSSSGRYLIDAATPCYAKNNA
jgi:hypothetical protein